MKKNRVILYFIIVIAAFLYNFYYRPVGKNPLLTEEYKNSDAYLNDLYVSDEYFKEQLLTTDEQILAYRNILHNGYKCKNGEECYSASSRVYVAVWLDHPEQIYKEESMIDP